MALDEIANFIALSDRLATSGQPTEAALRELAASGFEEIINLGLLDPRYCLPDEAGFVTSLGLRYTHIPVDFEAPSFDELLRFEAALQDAVERKVLVHCAANKRVSCFVALFGERALGWTRDQADAHVARIWQPNPVWAAFMASARSLLTGRGTRAAGDGVVNRGTMIIGAHAIVMSSKPEADRAFFKDVLKLGHVDEGGGWLIFGLPPSEVAVHPGKKDGVHELYLMCEDVFAFVAAMKKKKIATAPVQDQGWGVLTSVTLPGGGKLGVYEPRHQRPNAGGAKKAASKRPAAPKQATKKTAKKAAKKPAARKR